MFLDEEAVATPATEEATAAPVTTEEADQANSADQA